MSIRKISTVKTIQEYQEHVHEQWERYSEAFKRFRQSRFNARRIRKRVVFKHGDCNVAHSNVAKRRRKYLQDIFTTLVDAQWRWTLLVFALNFLLSWLLFAVVWWLIAYTHGDLSMERLVRGSSVNFFTSFYYG
ncbi:unnamed protein product [Acanthoscelides obtectus]|uniref:Potassium channel inwardly rectifying transmembrane domain-containing protein n=1 Tax=Acanthoscelides obtectus TaxID=200917 RepID=A0A9P0MD56_ACAOB|nr:unnamed protein product [Acanthoscelides obtectus]CAK1689276.1 ATP-sensitive inward rectifier potassium channel 8 [Acanthoscelides obtectus]